jgi:hypothetical protein
MIEIRPNTGKFVSRLVRSDRFIQLLSRHKYEFPDTFLTRPNNGQLVFRLPAPLGWGQICFGPVSRAAANQSANRVDVPTEWPVQHTVGGG